VQAQDHLLLGEWFWDFRVLSGTAFIFSLSPVCRVPSTGNRPMMSNYPLPNSQMIELTDRTNNNSDMNVTSQGLPANELDPGGRVILREHEIVFDFPESPSPGPSYYDSAVAARSHLIVPSINRIPPKMSRRRRRGDCSQPNCHMGTPNHTKQAKSDKPLRPLVSFMDEFFENIRNVGTQGG
jgi:hypothetical protein